MTYWIMGFVCALIAGGLIVLIWRKDFIPFDHLSQKEIDEFFLNPMKYKKDNKYYGDNTGWG